MKYSEFTVTQLPLDPRLDKVIPLNLSSVSRGAARRRIEAGAVYVNGKRCQQNGRTVRAGDRVRVMDEAEQRPDQQFQEFQFTADRILFEDKDWIVVNKPPALPTHETIDSTRHHLVRSLEQFLAAREKVSAEKIYLGLHHRLDVNTTGIILFTKRKEANAPVAQAFQERTVQKTYLAATLGELKDPAVIKSFLGESRQNKRKVESVHAGGKYAETAIRAVETKTIQARRVSLIEASPKTGRTHQIRVHLGENNLPILGDELYGVRFPGAKRVLLHAWQLEICGKTFHAPLPDDFRALGFSEPSGKASDEK